MATITQLPGLDQLQNSWKQLESWIRSQLYSTPDNQTDKHHCVAVYRSGNLIILVKRDHIISQHHLPLADLSESSVPILKKWVKEQNLALTPLTFILSPDDYQLFLIDGIKVEKSEYLEALKWHVKDLVHQPINELMVDYFEMPGTKTNKNVMCNVVVAMETHIRSIKHFLKSSGLSLTQVTIPEMCLKNLSSAFESDLKGTALLYFDETKVIFNISREKQLYLTKRLQFQSDSDNSEFLLEIQRCFDYSQNQWRHPKPSRVLLISSASDEEKNRLIQQLEEQLLISVSLFPTHSLLSQSGFIFETEHIDDMLFSTLIKESFHAEAKSESDSLR